jgi:hypothetical protein
MVLTFVFMFLFSIYLNSISNLIIEELARSQLNEMEDLNVYG